MLSDLQLTPASPVSWYWNTVGWSLKKWKCLLRVFFLDLPYFATPPSKRVSGCFGWPYNSTTPSGLWEVQRKPELPRQGWSTKTKHTHTPQVISHQHVILYLHEIIHFFLIEWVTVIPFQINSLFIQTSIIVRQSIGWSLVRLSLCHIPTDRKSVV